MTRRAGLAAVGVLGLLAVPLQAASGGPLAAVLVLGAVVALAGALRHPAGFAAAVALLYAAFALTEGRQVVQVAVLLVVVGTAWWTGRTRVALVVTAAAVAFTTLVAVRMSAFTGSSGPALPRGPGTAGPPVSPTVFGVMLAALLAAAALAGGVLRVRGQYRRELEVRAHQLEVDRDQRARIAVASERQRIAGEMHDIVAHSLTVMVRLSEGVLAGRTRARDAVDPPATRAVAGENEAAALTALAETGRTALAEMRRLLKVLSADEPATPEHGADATSRAPQPSARDLEGLVERLRSTGLVVDLDVTGSWEGWGPGAELSVFRIVQEALTNTLRHAGPEARVRVAVDAGPGTVVVMVEDDGAGRPSAPPGPDHDGRGLTGMAQRAGAWGGHVEAGSRAPHGWRVRAVLHRSVP